MLVALVALVAIIALVALLVVVIASFGTRLNVGILAVALSWPIAVYGAGWKADELIRVFPSSLFLTLLGVTKPVTLTFERFKCGQNPFTKKDRCGGNAVGSFKRSDFGMKYAVPAVGDEVFLNVEFEGDKS